MKYSTYVNYFRLDHGGSPYPSISSDVPRCNPHLISS